MNAYVSVADVARWPQIRGVAAVILELKPRHKQLPTTAPDALGVIGANAGAAPSDTVGEVMNKLGTDLRPGCHPAPHRPDQSVYNPSAPVDYEGQGMQIACISNSFNAHTAKPGVHGRDQLRPARRGDQPGQHHAGVRIPGRSFQHRQ